MNKDLLQNLLTYTLMNAIEGVKLEGSQLVYSDVKVGRVGNAIVVNEVYEVEDIILCKLYDRVVKFIKQKTQNSINDRIVSSFGDKQMYAYSKIELDWLKED